MSVLLKEITQGFIHLMYPRLCEGCKKPLSGKEEVLCLGCCSELPQTQYHEMENNDTSMRFAGRVPFQYASSFAYFTPDGLLQHLLHGLKYQGKKETGVFLGKQFAYDLGNTNWIKSLDLIIPVPLHAKKEALRGYNQSLLIAEGMSSILEIPVDVKTLQRVRHTESQTQKTRTERLNNMKNAFEIKNPDTISGKHILLVDDVLTTGATLEACALALLKIKDVKISIGTIGIAS